MQNEFDPIAILRALDKHNVKYIVIGGFASWIQGAPIVTTDIDVVYEPGKENVTALVKALTEMQAVYRHQLGKEIRPNQEGLASTTAAGHHLFSTRSGDLDALRTVADLGYRDLKEDVILFDIGGLEVQIATLEKIIFLKTKAGRPKDIAALPTLRAALKKRSE